MLTLSLSVLATARTSSDRKTMHMLHGSFQVSQTSAYDSSHLCFEHWQLLSLSVGQAIQLHLVALTASKAVVLRSPKQGSLETSKSLLLHICRDEWKNPFWNTHNVKKLLLAWGEREREISCIIFVWISYMSPIEALFFQWGKVSIMLLRVKHVVALGTLEKA